MKCSASRVAGRRATSWPICASSVLANGVPEPGQIVATESSTQAVCQRVPLSDGGVFPFRAGRPLVRMSTPSRTGVQIVGAASDLLCPHRFPRVLSLLFFWHAPAERTAHLSTCCRSSETLRSRGVRNWRIFPPSSGVDPPLCDWSRPRTSSIGISRETLLHGGVTHCAAVPLPITWRVQACKQNAAALSVLYVSWPTPSSLHCLHCEISGRRPARGPLTNRFRGSHARGGCVAALWRRADLLPDALAASRWRSFCWKTRQGAPCVPPDLFALPDVPLTPSLAPRVIEETCISARSRPAAAVITFRCRDDAPPRWRRSSSRCSADLCAGQ